MHPRRRRRREPRQVRRRGRRRRRHGDDVAPLLGPPRRRRAHGGPVHDEARVDRALCKRFNWESSASDALNGYRDGGDFYYRLFFDAAYRDRKDDLQKNTVAVALHGDPEARGSFLVAKLSSRDDARLPVTPREVAEVAAERFASAAARGLTDRMFAQHMRDTELDFIMQAANAAKR